MKSNSKSELFQILSPYGEWPHSGGLQIVDQEAAFLLRRSFESPFYNPLRRGLPIYIGHPDASTRTAKNAKVVGRIKRIQAIDGAIAVAVEYEPEIYRQILDGKYSAMSPRWQMRDIGDGKFRPARLISAGLTNNPNIPSSGLIIRFDGESPKILIESVKRVAAQNSRCKKLGERTNALSKRLGSLCGKLRTERIEIRNSQKRVGKISAAELAQKARQRSRLLGESYTKSFAAVKKESAHGFSKSGESPEQQKKDK